MEIMYLLDRETLIKLLSLLGELREDYDCVGLMRHAGYKKIGRRVKQVRWG